MFFKMEMGDHFGLEGQDVKNKLSPFHCFFQAKIVGFGILYMHTYAYILLSPKVIRFFSKLRWWLYWI